MTWFWDNKTYRREVVYRGFLIRVRRSDGWHELWLLNELDDKIELFAGTSHVDILDGILENHMALFSTPSYRWLSIDGVPWVIHAIHDEEARHAATTAWRAEQHDSIFDRGSGRDRGFVL